MSFFCHESSIIDDGAIIGSGSKIWHFCHICCGATVGKNVSIGQNCFVGSKAVIGNRCKIQNNVSIYDRVILEEDVFVGPSAVFTNVFNPRAEIEKKNEYRKTLICKGATLGANCTVVCGAKVGTYSFVGAGAVVNTDVEPFALVVGVPARQIGWVDKQGEKLNLPITGNGHFECSMTGDNYTVSNGKLKHTPSN